MTALPPAQKFDDSDEGPILEDTAKYWRSVWNETPVQAIARIEDAAKQVIVVTIGLQGLYLAVFAFSTIHSQVITALGNWLGTFILLLFCLPLVCWLFSLFYATRVFVPRVYPGINFNEVSVGAWQKVKEEYGRVGGKKLRWLHCSHAWLIASFVLVLLMVGLLVLLPTAPTGPTPIIVVTPTPTH